MCALLQCHLWGSAAAWIVSSLTDCLLLAPCLLALPFGGLGSRPGRLLLPAGLLFCQQLRRGCCRRCLRCRKVLALCLLAGRLSPELAPRLPQLGARPTKRGLLRVQGLVHQPLQLDQPPLAQHFLQRRVGAAQSSG